MDKADNHKHTIFKHCSTQVGSSLPANIRLGWKGPTMTNTPAYYCKELITTIKSFIVQVSEFQNLLALNICGVELNRN